MGQRGFRHAATPAFACCPAVLLLPFGRESFLPAIVETFDGREVKMDETTDRLVFDLQAAPRPTTLVYSGMGGPAVANALEMVAANGAERTVIFGACGGVESSLTTGDLVVATAAVRGDGASSYYAPAGYPAVFDPDLTAALWRLAQESGATARRGVVFTTAASYRQGPEVYEKYAGLVLAVECEAATAAVVGARLALATGCLLFCTDNAVSEREEERSYRGLADARVRGGFEAGLTAALAALAEPTRRAEAPA